MQKPTLTPATGHAAAVALLNAIHKWEYLSSTERVGDLPSPGKLAAIAEVEWRAQDLCEASTGEVQDRFDAFLRDGQMNDWHSPSMDPKVIRAAINAADTVHLDAWNARFDAAAEIASESWSIDDDGVFHGRRAVQLTPQQAKAVRVLRKSASTLAQLKTVMCKPGSSNESAERAIWRLTDKLTDAGFSVSSRGGKYRILSNTDKSVSFR